MKISPTGYWEDDKDLYHVCDSGLVTWIGSFLQKDKQLYDFGCGLGHYLVPLKETGFTKLTGIEGKKAPNNQFDNIIEHDLTIPFFLKKKGNCLSLEVAEHIPAEYEEDYLKNITKPCDDKLIISWALLDPYQPGNGHVNCRNNDYVIARLAGFGFKFLDQETASARESVSTYPWFKNTVMVFEKIG